MPIFPRDRFGRYYNPEKPIAAPKRKRVARRVSTIICRHCGKTFSAFRANAKYCSDSCRQAARYERRTTLTDKERAYLDLLRQVPSMAEYLNSVKTGRITGSDGLKKTLYAFAACLKHFNTSQKTS